MTGRDWKGWVSYSRVVTSRDVDAGIGAWSACSSYRYIYIGHPYSLLPIHYHPLPCTTPPLLESPTYTYLLVRGEVWVQWEEYSGDRS